MSGSTTEIATLRLSSTEGVKSGTNRQRHRLWPVETETSRPIRRTSSQTLEKRAGETAVRPIVSSINRWRQTAVRLGARLEHSRLRGEDLSDVRNEINGLAEEVSTTVDAWRAGLNAADASGRVEDVDRAISSITSLIDSYRQRSE